MRANAVAPQRQHQLGDVGESGAQSGMFGAVCCTITRPRGVGGACLFCRSSSLGLELRRGQTIPATVQSCCIHDPLVFAHIEHFLLKSLHCGFVLTERPMKRLL
jgi:hypothetical protein